jgi:serine/threonine protein kinase
MSLEVGVKLDRRWILKRLVARSERGRIFEAEHAHLRRLAFVRLLAEGSGDDSAAKSALLREARLLDEVQHPNLVRVFDLADTDGGDAYMVTEAVPGRPLDGLLSIRGSLPPEDAIHVTLAVADALGAAHAAGIFHAGLCPGSILVLERPPDDGATTAKLMDLGVSPTPMGLLDGTLAAMGYASPQRIAGAPQNPADDIHALGAILHEMLTGNLPSEGVVEVPKGLREVIETALGGSDSRFHSMADLAAALVESTLVGTLPPSVPPPARRVHFRAAYVTPVRVRRPNGDALDGRTEDISQGGLLIVLNGDLETDEKVLVRFALPSSGRLVSVPAQTRWARAAAGKKAFGLQFEDPGEKEAADIKAYVDYLGKPAP